MTKAVLPADLTATEEIFLDSCVVGEPVTLGQTLPASSTPETAIRGELIKFLLLGGNEQYKPNRKGIDLRGAWVEDLALEYCISPLPLRFLNCHFPHRPNLEYSNLGAVAFVGCKLEEGVDFLGMVTRGDVVLRNSDFKDTVNLFTARIGGGLDCDDASFVGFMQPALDLEATDVGISVFLRRAKLRGQAQLRVANIAQNLECDGAQFDGKGRRALNVVDATIGGNAFIRGELKARGAINFSGTKIGGGLECLNCNLSCTSDAELILHGAQISGTLSIKGLTTSRGSVVLQDAIVKRLSDDWASWSKVHRVWLDGFEYEYLVGALTVNERLEWLRKNVERGIPGGLADGFDPSPYSQLARVYDNAGNVFFGSRVRMEREHRLCLAERRNSKQLDGSVEAGIRSLWIDARQFFGLDWAFRWVFGYGHAPARSFLWVIGIWFIAFLIYGEAFRSGQMAPNDSVILTSASWLSAIETAERSEGMPLHHWLSDPQNIDYETFSAALYALDLFVPLDALGQEKAWAPSKDRGVIGALAYWARMPIQVSGWLITAMAAAVLTGLVGRKD